MKLKYLFVISALLLSVGVSRAEGLRTMGNIATDSYLGLGFRAGLSQLGVSGSLNGTSNSGFGYGFDVLYQGFFSRYCGFTTGVSVSIAKSGTVYGDFTSKYNGSMMLSSSGSTTMWVDGYYSGVTRSIEETYSAVFFEIPIMFSLRREESGIYGNVGFKLAIPIKLKAEYNYSNSSFTLDEVVNTGTHIPSGYEIGTKPSGNGAYDTYGGGNGVLQTLNLMAGTEVGYRLLFDDNASLAFALFLDCTLTRFKVNGSQDDIVSFAVDNRGNLGDMTYKGAFLSGGVDAFSFFQFGVKAQYNIGLGEVSRRSGRAILIL